MTRSRGWAAGVTVLVAAASTSAVEPYPFQAQGIEAADAPRELRIEYPAAMLEGETWLRGPDAVAPEPGRVIYRIMSDGNRGFHVPNGHLELRTKAEAVRYFSEAELAEVDFRKQYVLLLSWGGSGQDEIRASCNGTEPKKVVFEITEGFTFDYCSHFRVYAIQSGVTWSVAKAAAPAPPAAPSAVEALGRVMVSGPAFNRWGRLVPVEVRTREEAAKYFKDDALRTIDSRVDFGSKYVVIFAWIASSYDRLTFADSDSDASNAVFVYEKAMTCDCGHNVHVYSLPVDMKWRMDEPKR